MTDRERDTLRPLFLIMPKGSMLKAYRPHVIASLVRKGYIRSMDGGFGKIYMITQTGLEEYLK